MEPSEERALHVSQDAQADLLNCKGQVKLHQGEVLEGPSEAPIPRGVGDRGTTNGGQLGPCIFWRAIGWHSDKHASLLEGVDSILSLPHKQVGVVPCHNNPRSLGLVMANFEWRRVVMC